MIPVVDRSLCFSSGECVLAAPTAFALDDEGLAVVVDPAALSDEELQRVAQQCPSGAITLQPAP